MASTGQLSFADLEVAAHPRAASEPSSSRPADRAALSALETALADARASADNRPPLIVLASCLGELAVSAAPRSAPPSSLRAARDDWLRRLETSHKSESALVAYRVAIDDMLDRSDANGRNLLEEAAIVEYLRTYEQRAHPAPATYYRRFLLVRRFLRWA